MFSKLLKEILATDKRVAKYADKTLADAKASKASSEARMVQWDKDEVADMQSQRDYLDNRPTRSKSQQQSITDFIAKAQGGI